MSAAYPSITVAAAGTSPAPAISELQLGDHVRSFLPDKKPVQSGDPTAQATNVGKKFRTSIEGIISGCFLIKSVLDDFPAGSAERDAFIQGLVAESVLSRKESRLGAADGSKLSMLYKIGEFADLLRNCEVLRRLQPGYTILYQVTVLYKALQGDQQDRLSRLIQLLNECEGDLTREYLIRQTKLAKKAVRAAQPAARGHGAAVKATDLIEGGQLFDLVGLTPSREDLRLLGADYPDLSNLPRCLRVHEMVTEDAVALVLATVGDLPTIVDRLLPSCGFYGLSRVMLVRRPASPDVTTSAAIIVATRNRKTATGFPLDLWEQPEAFSDLASTAATLFPDASHKLHVFASEATAGPTDWVAIVGDDNWVERPTLR